MRKIAQFLNNVDLPGLMIFISIIAILVAIAIPAFQQAKEEHTVAEKCEMKGGVLVRFEDGRRCVSKRLFLD